MAEFGSPVKLPQPSGSPLLPISPERINRRETNASPTKSIDGTASPSRSGRGTSEVQAKVAFLNRLSSVTTPERSATHVSTTTAALQRAILGREEAESVLQSTLAQLSEANARERRVSERLESLVEELRSLKERQVHERAVFEKEVRKARKEAFRAGSTLVKAQEELKYSRGQLKSVKEEIKAEREAKEKAKQEAFERAYALAGLTEELEALKGKLRSSEAENQPRDSEIQSEDSQLETPTIGQNEQVSAPVFTSPGSRGLKRCQPDSLDHRSPSRKRSLNRRDRLSSSLESPTKLSATTADTSEQCNLEDGANAHTSDLLESLNDDLQWERQLRRKAEDMIDFLKMECQFRRCSCRLAERGGTRYIHDASWEKLCPNAAPQVEGSKVSTEVKESKSQPQEPPSASTSTTAASGERHESEKQPDEPVVTFCPDTGTFRVIPSPLRSGESKFARVSNNSNESFDRQASLASGPTSRDFSTARHSEQMETPDISDGSQNDHIPEYDQSRSLHHPLNHKSAPIDNKPYHSVFGTTPAEYPHQFSFQTITTTTTIPLHTESGNSSSALSFCPIPDTPINREEALAQIRARRDRTQCALKRSASANDANSRSGMPASAITPMRGSRRIPRNENGDNKSDPSKTSLGAGIRVRRDFSAPIHSTRKSYR